MIARHGFGLLFLILLALVGSLLACKTDDISPYEWKTGFYGGDNSMLYVEPDRLILDVTCATIELEKLPQLNEGNTFLAQGLYTFTPGIVSEYQNISDFQQKAFLSGKITNPNTVELTYELEKDKTVKRLMLIYNSKVDVFKCP